MATTHDHDTHGPIPDPDTPDQGMSKTLLVQGAILGGIVVLLLLASFFDLI